MKNNFLHTTVAFVLVGLLVLLTDPLMYWMPPMAAMSALVAVAVLLCAWAGFVMYEKADDEREVLHRMQAGRAAYLAGIAILALGLLWQGFVEHHIDVWIAAALGCMVLAKLSVGLFLSIYR